MLKKVVYAGAQSASFVQATKDLDALAEIAVSRERVQRWTKRVGHERVAEVARQAASYQSLPLPERRHSPTGQIPQVACVQMDGGRLQIRDRREEASSVGEGAGYWRESLVGCLLSMASREHAADPCQKLPATFADARRMRELSREIKGFSSAADPPDDMMAEEVSADRPERPQVLVRSVVATREGLEVFGQRLVAAAYARGFHAASRKAFVSDGAASNWSVHKAHFSHYTPVLDFTHAVCYVYQAAMAGRSTAAGWEHYCRWAQWLWEGSTDELIAAIAARGKELGLPGEGEPAGSPGQILASTLGYLQNQRSRMRYAEYRRQGLPITSSHIESTIKQINRRVKGTEKFWDRGAEPLLQLAADHLSETRPLAPFWKARPSRLQSMRRLVTA
jgi:hypothetical protein